MNTDLQRKIDELLERHREALGRDGEASDPFSTFLDRHPSETRAVRQLAGDEGSPAR